MLNPIAISLSPNTSIQDITLALKLLLTPWKWQKGGAIKALEEQFKDFFKVRYAVSFNSGRSAELAILKAMGIGRGDEILIQAYTCVAVPNSILWSGGKPVYVDIDPQTFNIDLADLERKITPRSRVVIVQHTFGQPVQLNEVIKIVKKHKLLLIEDCAHALGASYHGGKVGTFGDAAFFSFGRDKIISSVFGGMAITNDEKLGKKLAEFQKSLPFSPKWWIAQQLFHPVAFFLILPFYNFFNLGKILLVLLQKLRLLSYAVDTCEKTGKKPGLYPTPLPNGLASLALAQMKQLDEFNARRRKIAKFYARTLKKLPLKLPKTTPRAIPAFLRYTIRLSKAEELIQFAKKKGIILGDWYRSVISPKGTLLAQVGYKANTCPRAEKAAEESVNLPTHPKMDLRQAKRVVKLIKEFFEKERQ